MLHSIVIARCQPSLECERDDFRTYSCVCSNFDGITSTITLIVLHTTSISSVLLGREHYHKLICAGSFNTTAAKPKRELIQHSLATEVISGAGASPVGNMSQINVLDRYYLSITLLITLAYQAIGFTIAFTLKFDKITDFMGGSNFVIISALTLGLASSASAGLSARQYLASLFIIVWGARLSGFLLFRILKTGKDDRFDDKRDSIVKFGGFWVFQMIWVWTVSMPVTILNSPAVQRYDPQRTGIGACEGVGIAMWAIGFLCESVSDVQKYRFRSNPSNKGRTCDVGLFSWSRHPNYFGEMLLQFGIYLIALGPTAYGVVPPRTGTAAAQVASIVGPCLLCTLLLFVSGLTLQERQSAKKKYESDGPDGEGWLQFKRWTEQTSILVPMPPALWKALPRAAKGTVGFEWPMYVFIPEKHADMAKVKGRRQEEGRGDAHGSESERNLVSS